MHCRNSSSVIRGSSIRTCVALVLLPLGFTSAAISASAQTKSPVQISSGTAVFFTESKPVRELPAIAALTALPKGKESTGEKGINPENREIIHRIDPKAPGTPDAAIARVVRRSSRLSQISIPAPGVSFDGIGNPDGCGTCLPPDTNGEIGPNHFVQTVNSAFRVFSRTGAPLTPVMSLGSLFASIPGACANTSDGDPIVLYDQLADRWIISEFCIVANPNNHQLIAVSKTGDPTGAYFLYDFMMPNNSFNDYPHLGVWADGYYMTDNQFNQAGTAFQGAGVFAFNRAKMLAGDPTASFVYFNKNDNCDATGAACTFGGMLPADFDGLTPPPLGAPAPFAMFDADEFGAGHTDSMRLFDFHADFAVPANSTFTERTGSPLAVAAFDPREVPSGSRNVIPQPAGGVALDAISDRLMFRLAYRNFGDHESLALNHTVNAAVNPAFRAGVRYYQLQRATAAAPWSVQEQATMAGGVGDTENRWMGSTALNAAGSQAVGYSVSSATVFPSIRYAGRLAGDPAGSLAQGENTLVAGAGVQTSTSGRWGDYSDLTVDPADDCTFWYTQEYYPATAGATWKTRIGSFQFGVCAPTPRGTISGTITNCQTGLPVPNVFVAITGGFVRTTDASGNYSASVPAGTYSASATTTGFDTLTAPSLVVTDGGTTTFGGCLTGNLKQPVADTASVTADNCNSNGFIDPNELVTVSLGIKNTGTLNTASLVATLQATGGVTSPSGPQNYGIVVAGGSTVSRSFTFTAGNLACGAPLVATLQMQDGATNLGTITYNFTTGQQLIALNENFDGVVAPALPAGWVASGTATTWVTSITTPDSAPNDAFVDDPAAVSDKLLETPGIVITSTSAQVSFRNNYDTESTFDGAVLEVSSPNINAGAYTDITNAAVGGSFVSGGYNATISSSFSNPLAGRSAWSGTSGGYINTVANLGPNVVGQTVKLRFRMASDSSLAGTGWRIDTLKVSNGTVCCGALITAVPPATIAAENFTPANNAPDPGEFVTVNLPLHNLGGSNTTSLVATLQATGGVTSPSSPQNYGIVVGGGASVARSFSFIASGTCGNNITLTLALQDGATSFGTVTYTLQLGGTAPVTTTFSNATSITIPAGAPTTTSGPATPYPSNIVVSGVTGTSSKVTVDLKGLNHTFPDDVDVLLVGPGGQTFIIMSDTGGTNDWANANITLDDSAAALLSDSGANPTGIYKPTNIGTGDTFVAPAPGGTYGTPATAGSATFASVFNGANPNGTWSLYVVDDVGGDVGTMTGGWSITITTASPVCVANQAPQIINGPPPSPVIVGTPYSFAFAASGNPAPTFSLSGALPPGLMFSAAGVLSGTATSGGTGNFPGIMVTASNAVAPPAMQTFALSTATRANNYIASFGLSGSDAVLTFDYDHDGLANLLEYALGLNPTVAGLSGSPTVTLKDYSGTFYLSMLFHRSSLATDLTYIVQVSPDLVTWTDVATSTAGGITSGPGFVPPETGSAPNFTVEVRDTVPYDPMMLNKRFMRLKITSP